MGDIGRGGLFLERPPARFPPGSAKACYRGRFALFVPLHAWQDGASVTMSALQQRSTSLALAAALSLAGCSFDQYALDRLTSGFAAGAEAFANEDDPELVRYSMPITLKAMEAVLLRDPENTDVLTAAAAAFSLYGYAFVQRDAQKLEYVNYRAFLETQERALRLFLRARDYGLRSLEVRHPGIAVALLRDPFRAVEVLSTEDVDAAYWCAGAWGLAISAGRDRPELLADIDAVRALLRASLILEESYGEGALHRAMIVVEGLPEIMGGSTERAREHFRRAIELSGGQVAETYVSLAENVALPAQDQEEFVQLLTRALEIDLDARPRLRLSNRLAQSRARELLEQLDDLFL